MPNAEIITQDNNVIIQNDGFITAQTITIEQKLDETIDISPPLDDNDELPLTFICNKNVSDTIQIMLASSRLRPNTLLYRTSKNTEWTAYNIYETLEMQNKSEWIQFKNTASTLSISSSEYIYFIMHVYSNADVSIKGNVNSLINYSDTCPEYCFYKLFSGVFAFGGPTLPAITLNSHCYELMFENTAISNVTIGFKTWDDENECTLNWFKNIKMTPVIFKLLELEDKRGDSYIPTDSGVYNTTISKSLCLQGILNKSINEYTEEDLLTTIKVPYDSSTNSGLNISNNEIEFTIVGINNFQNPINHRRKTLTLMASSILRKMEFSSKRTSGKSSQDQGNRWSTSNIRQWMNSDKSANEWFTPQNEFDVEPSYAQQDGFLKGFSHEFKSHILPVLNITQINEIFTNGVYEQTIDKVFLPSYTQLFDLPKEDVYEGDLFSEQIKTSRHRSGSGVNTYWLRSGLEQSSINVQGCWMGGSGDSIYYYWNGWGFCPVIVIY